VGQTFLSDGFLLLGYWFYKRFAYCLLDAPNHTHSNARITDAAIAARNATCIPRGKCHPHPIESAAIKRHTKNSTALRHDRKRMMATIGEILRPSPRKVAFRCPPGQRVASWGPTLRELLSLFPLMRENDSSMSAPGQAELIAAARAASENAHAPFSNFKVGAALRSKSGKIFTGCNVENASYGLTICAERNAIFKAISEGERSGGFDAIAVFTAAEKLTPPCGACRQIIWEFCGDCEVILSNTRGQTESFKMSALLPRAFDASNL